MIRERLVVRALLVNNDGKVLVLRRSPDDEYSPGRVDLPGGGVDPGESYVQAVAREITEEAGLSVLEKDLGLAHAFSTYDSSINTVITRLLYISHVADKAVSLSHEHDAYWWCPPDELDRLFTGISWHRGIRFVYKHDLA